MLNVTKTFLPDLDSYVSHLRDIWDSGWLTNHGPKVLELEKQLKEYLGVKHFFFLNNGTIALQIAIKALGAEGGEIVTTPFSYVATTSSIVWEGCRPVFADINPDTLCISPESVVERITPQTKAILAVHVYGGPCDVEALELIGREYKIPVIYDAAHAFGVKHRGRSLLSWGDVSTLSFHATKVFHTIEGGAVITNNDEIAHRLSYMRNFGHDGPTAFHGVGINGKASEFNAAMGLCILPQIEDLIAARQAAYENYDELLHDAYSRPFGDPAGLSKPHIIATDRYNYSYYPVLFDSEEALLSAVNALQAAGVNPRRYFYPSLNTLHYLESYQPAPVSEEVSSRVLCLPLFPGIQLEQQELVVATIYHSLSATKARALKADAA